MKSTIEEINIDLTDNTGCLELNRPELRNAISTKMWQAIPELLSLLYAKGARSVVIKGADGCFAAGADLLELKGIESYKSAFKFWNAIKETLDFVHSFNIPTIAMIDGPCLGGGCLLATACDIRLASNISTFSVPIAKFGIVLDDETVARLVSLVGPARAGELLYGGDTISSEDAEHFGLINRSLPAEKLEDYITNLTSRIAENGYASNYESKKSIRRAIFQGDKSGLTPQHESVVVSSYLTSDFRKRVEKGEKNSG